MRVLLTRPQPDAERTAAALRRLGHEVLYAPMLRIEWVADADLGAGPWTGIVMTSANAARAIADHPRRSELTPLTAYAVGRQTAQAARAIGFAQVETAEGDQRDLVDLLANRTAPGSPALLYLAGADRSGDLAGELAGRGVRVEIAIVYRAIGAEHFTSETEAAFRGREIDAVLHFSRRSANAFLAAARSAGLVDDSLGARHYCLSAQVAEPLVAAGVTPIRVAAKPDEEALLALLGA